jgi:hypothetical protein
MLITTFTANVSTTTLAIPRRTGRGRAPRVELRFGVVHVVFPTPRPGRRGAPTFATSGSALWRLGPWSPARPCP